MLAVVEATLVIVVNILKLGLRYILKSIISLIFLNIYTPPQHVLTHTILFVLTEKANFKFDLNIKEALHSNLRKPNLNAQKNHFLLTLSL